tara:strand:+ start:1165 stop:1476 length:312 start_codon:yes stop_codon:yes gene_type:complete
MPFKKGESGNPKGKPVGLKNKLTKEGRELFIKIMDGQVEHIEEELALLRESSGEKYLKALASLFPYFLPKMVETQIHINEPLNEPSWFADVLEREDQKDDIND